MTKNVAFTLAEVLITLGIIGVVAALTLPSLIQKYQKQEYATAFNKAYSVLSQALLRAQDDIGGFDNWDLIDNNADSSEQFYLTLKPYLKVLRECKNESGCWSDERTRNLKGNAYSEVENGNRFIGQYYYGFTLVDGMNVSIDLWTDVTRLGITKFLSNNKTVAAFIVDVNGDKKPNRMGRDVFIFVQNQRGLVPAGLDVDFDEYCNINNGSSRNGNFCAAKLQ